MFLMRSCVSRFRWGLMLCGWMLLLAPLRGEDQEAKAREDWMAGYVKLEEGGRAEEGGDVAQALALYREALQTFEAVRRQYPGWNPSLLGYRITYCTQRIRRIESQVKQQSPEMSQPELAKMVSEQVDKIRTLTDENQAMKARLSTTAAALERARVESARTVSAAEDIKDVMAERARLKEENAALLQQVEQLTGSVSELRQKSGIEQVAKQLQQDLERTRSREQQLEQAFDTYRRAYENVKEKLRQTTVEQEQWQRQNRDLNDRTEAAVATAAEARRRTTELETRTVALEQQRADDAANLAQKQTEVEQVRRDLGTARTELTDLRRLRDQAAQESGERQHLVEQAQRLAVGKTAAETRVAALGTELQVAKDRVVVLEQREQERGATTETRVAALGTELQVAKDRVAVLEQREQEREAALRAQSAAMTRECDGLRTQTETLGGERDRARADLAAALARQADLERRLQAQPRPSAETPAPAVALPRAAAVPEIDPGAQRLLTPAVEAAALRREMEVLRADLARWKERAEQLPAVQIQVGALRQDAATLRTDLAQEKRRAETLSVVEEQAAALRREMEVLRTDLAQEKRRAETLPVVEEQAATLQRAVEVLRTDLAQEKRRAETLPAVEEQAAALRREMEVLRADLAQEKRRAETLPDLEEKAATLLRERVDAERQLATARGMIETQQTLLQAQGEKLTSAGSVGRLLEDKEKALAAAVAEVETLRQDLVRERTALAAQRDDRRESQARVQQLTAKAADLETQNVALVAQMRDRGRADADSGRLRQDTQEQLRQARELLTAAEGERTQLRQKTDDQLALLRQQEKSLRDLEQQRRELGDRTELLTREVASLKTAGEAQTAAFARETASMKAKTEVVDGLAASLSDADALTQGLKRQVAVLQQDKAAVETRFLEARRETQEREQEIARYRSAVAQGTTAKEKALTQQLKEASARVEAETEKRRALEVVLASLPAPVTASPSLATGSTVTPVDPERDRRAREQTTLVRGYLRQAVAAEKDGKVEAARWNYLRVLEHDGESKLAAQRLGLIAADHGSDEDAERYLKRAFKLDPDDLQTIVPLGFALLRRQEPDLAVSMLSRAVALEPTNAVAHRCLGLACSSLGWYDAAEVQFRRAHELNSKDAENAFNLAVLLSSRQPPRQEEARQWYERALALGSARDPGLDRLFGVGK